MLKRVLARRKDRVTSQDKQAKQKQSINYCPDNQSISQIIFNHSFLLFLGFFHFVSSRILQMVAGALAGPRSGST
jgi:hypothetical protein